MKRTMRPSGGARQALRFSLCALSAAVLAACGGGSNDTSNAGTTPGVTGKISYDYVPTAYTVQADGTATGGLDYAKTEKRPVRHALVELVSEDGTTVLGKTTTDDYGAYSIEAPAGKRAYVRVTAQASQGADNAPDYSVKIRDNTSPEYKRAPDTAALYSMRGSAFSTTSASMKLDLNAGSGWTGAGYGAPRTAAPFAILDQIVNAAQQLHAAAPSVLLPELNVYWSVNNRPTGGDQSSGFIWTSHYENVAPSKGLYILGAENVDTDEYDTSVIVHEFGHYVEANVSRSDSIGGNHSSTDVLDMRLAFGEAWGNAFSSMMRGTPVYTDTFGPRQAQIAIYMRLDQVPPDEAPTWFNEAAVGNFLYSLQQSPDIGFTQLYRTMLTGEKTTPALTSVFSFATALRPGLTDAGKRKLDTSLGAIHVQGGNLLDAWGTQTKYTGDPAAANPAVFPIYVPLRVGQTVTACSTTQFGGGNKLGNRRHLRVTVPAAGQYRLTIAPVAAGSTANDYAMEAYVVGQAVPDQDAGNGVTTVAFPAAGDFPVDVASAADLDPSAPIGTAPHCATVSLQSANP
ncbi:hypothetical protein ACFSHT_14995 [Paraburkholderia silviterrae]|uniref:Uncharacterized protein n=1 Tax=Paraburkholderia silviterrae TaxID=2528715 RepID=A0A4R5MAM2_9BURK|nr:hypothetical protein [Paraburkholderia silviterrae]TDG23380.1 hypothetical protein EYW47_15815 [Paraburkholderia silviterrae]